MRKTWFGLIILLTLLLAGCHTSHGANGASSASQTNLAPQPYTRIYNPDTNTVQLQIAIRKFVPRRGRGPAIWLVGTSHIGETNYYRTVQNYLDARNVVLYEGINAGAHKLRITKPGVVETNLAPAPPAGDKADEGFSMQSALAKSLGLVFQLDAIDYDRTNFINSDLSVLQIQRLMINDQNAVPVAPGQKGRSSPSFDALLQVMDGSSFLGGLLKLAVQFIGSNPNLQAVTRLMFIDAIGNLKGDFSEMRGLPPDMEHLLKVLIEARNRNVVDDLKAELKILPRSGSVAVFYGTGHMDNMEKSITRQLHYRPDGDIWLTAFSVDLRQTGLPRGQLLMLRNMVKAQMEEMQP
jgi:hypothetical protein